MIFEGQEKDDFWKAIGGREEYASEKRLQEDQDEHQIRLFQCSNASGQFVVDELPDFTQVSCLFVDLLFWHCKHCVGKLFKMK